MKYSAIVFILFLIITSCENNLKTDREPAVYGKVFDESGNPVANAEVCVIPNLPKSVIGGIIDIKDFEPYKINEVELIYFDANQKDNFILIHWTTASEINSDKFILEKSIYQNGSFGDYFIIDSLPGANNSMTEKNYSIKDYDVEDEGFYQYRLKAVNKNGEYQYSNPINFQYIIPKMSLSQNHPNPFNNTTNIHLQITDVNSQYIEVIEKTTDETIFKYNDFKDQGNYSFEFNFLKDGKHLRPGIFQAKLHSNDTTLITNMIKHFQFRTDDCEIPINVTTTDKNGKFKIPYYWFPDTMMVYRVALDGSVLGKFKYGTQANIITRKKINEDENTITYEVSENEIYIDKSLMVDMDCVTKTYQITK